MKILLVSNNLVIDNIIYNYDTLVEEKRINRPLSIKGEEKMQRLFSNLNFNSIYSSNYASALCSAKYISKQNNAPIIIDKDLKDAIIGEMGKNNIQMLRYMQERNFDFKYSQGESLNDTKRRMLNCLNKIIQKKTDAIVFTHKRAMLAYLLLYCEQGFNLDDRLILSYNNEIILDDSENDMDIIQLIITDNKITDIKRIEVENDD